MDIKELKTLIIEKNIDHSFYIFKYTSNDFIAIQYINEISKIFNVDIEYYDSLDDIQFYSDDIFGMHDNNEILRIVRTDVFDSINEKLKNELNLIVVCKKIDKNSQEIFESNIIEFPKLEDWQIQDYVYSLAEGIDQNKLDELIKLCKGDIYRLDNELKKINIFNKNERKFVFDDFLYEGIFSDLSYHNIFDFSNALLKKDTKALTTLYSEIEKIDCEPLGLVTILYQSIKNIISIQLSPNATPESVGLPTNRFWAIKKNNCGYYSRDQLIEIFNLITSIDRKLKNGDITIDIMIDYIVCHMLSI